MRQSNAYLTPAGLFVALGLNEAFSAALLLWSVPNKSSAMWRLSLLALFLIFVMGIINFLSIDYTSSPFMVPVGFLGYLFVSAYAINFITTVVMTILFLMRIKLFYGKGSVFFKSMVALGCLLIAIKASGDAIFAKVSLDFAQGKVSNPKEHSMFPIAPLIMAFGALAEGAFSTIGSVSFLYYLTDFGSGDWNDIRDTVFKREGVRLTLIVATHLVLTYLAVWVWIDDK